MAGRLSPVTPSAARRSGQRPARTLWGVSMLLAGAASAQVNLDFEHGRAGWDVDDRETTIAPDASMARTGAQSLRVAPHADDRARFSQTLDVRELTGDRVRVTAYVAAQSAAAANLRIRVDGEGGLLYISRASARTSEADGWRRVVIEAPLAPAARRLEFGGEVSGGSAWFDDFRVESLLARDLPPPSAAASRYVAQALAIIDEHAVTRTALDWPHYRSTVLDQARGAVTTADAHLAVQFALSALGDGHSYFMTPRQMDNLDERPLGNARTARAPVAPRATLLEGGIGYLALPGIAGGEHLDRVAFAETVQRLIAEHDPHAGCGWMLDLRDNQGGNVWPMLAGVGPLLGDGEVAYSIDRRGGRRSLWYVDGKAGLGDYVQLRVRGAPYRLERSAAPVAVLLNDETASAAEIVALAFVGRPRARSFGSPTDGAGTATRTFPLSDGAALMLAVASLADRNGRVLHGPIEPDEPQHEAPRGRPLAEQAVVVAAARWLRAESACAGGAAALAERGG